MVIHNFEQNSEEWFAIKRGKFSASNCLKHFSAKSTESYQETILKPVYERLTGFSPDSFKSDWMNRGNELEDNARIDYEITKGVKVDIVGFVELNEWIGCSPDGLIGNDGLIEIKCPKYTTHIDYLLTGKIPKQYLYQMYFQMWVTGRKWCDFVSYCQGMKLLITRVERDEKIISEIEARMLISISEAKDYLKKLSE